MRQALYEYVSRLANADFLTSNKFAKRGLQAVINRYRNGGAHDSPISEETCLKCVEALIGTEEKPGYIPLVARWKGKE